VREKYVRIISETWVYVKALRPHVERNTTAQHRQQDAYIRPVIG
jgi:hypothetical protein